MFIGGDDTRLFYYFPWEYIINSAFYSWANVSSVGFNNPNQHQLPFLFLWSLLYQIFQNRIIIGYLAFSLPLIVGFIYFEKFINELTNNKYKISAYIGALFYIFSPIIQVNQLSYFLTSAFLIGFFPFISFYFLRYLKTSEFSYIWKAILLGLFFSITTYNIPGIIGLIVCLFIGLIVALFLYTKKELFLFIKKSFIFFGLFGLSQLFWIIPFASMFFVKTGNSFGQQISLISNTFTSTVLGSATGNIIYPLLNLFHRQLIIDFEWQVKDVFFQFYDKTFFINSIYLVVVLLGLYLLKRKSKNSEIKIFLITFSSFLFSLFVFTVNIGPLKDVFILIKFLPMSVMFRNFYDKFALGYVFLYAMLLSLSIGIIIKNFPKFRLHLFFTLIFVILFGAIPIRQVVNNHLWTTKSTYKVISIPEEYTLFLESVKQTVDPSAYVLNIPYNLGGYSVIKDPQDNSVYAGTSPLKIFTGINDISGSYSFPGSFFGNEVKEWWRSILERDYDNIRKIMKRFNMNYVFVTKNIPYEVQYSYLFDRGDRIQTQDEDFLAAITNKRILVSSEGNYELYTAKNRNLLFSSENLYFQKINPTKYLIHIRNLKKQDLLFFESFHPGWKLYATNKSPDCINNKNIVVSINKVYECRYKYSAFDIEDISYLWKTPAFADSHKTYDDFFNKWTVEDSRDATLVLYFMPQSYFYLGTLLSFIVFVVCSAYLIKSKFKNG